MTDVSHLLYDGLSREEVISDIIADINIALEESDLETADRHAALEVIALSRRLLDRLEALFPPSDEPGLPSR
jgi:hypothetical protein